jgi:hypothetical protein
VIFVAKPFVTFVAKPFVTFVAKPFVTFVAKAFVTFVYQKSNVTLNRAKRAFSTCVGASHVAPLVTGSYVWL